MKVNTALSFLCLGAGLWLAGNDERRRSRSILGLLVVIIAGLTLAEYAFHISLGIDQLLFRDTRTPSLSAYPGRMAIATAICFLLLGSAVMFLGSKKGLVLQRALVVACFAFSLVALCGYLYGAESLYSITSFSTVGVHTSAGLMAVCLAYFLARPNEGLASIAASDSNSGFLLRTLGPAIIVVPILIGWLKLAGQRARLYDTPFGVALLVLVNIGCLAALTMLIARSMHRHERDLEEVSEALRTREELLKTFVKNVPAGVAMFDRDMRYLQASDRWCTDYGADVSQILGRSHYEVFPDMPDVWKQVHGRALEGETLRVDEDRWDREGSTTWIRWEVRPWLNRERLPGGIVIFAEDITYRKRAEQALSDMTRKLVEAQEKERDRIARELHDDVSQRLAMLAIGIAQLQANPSEVWSRLQELRKQTTEISDDVQALSHELDSSKLDYLGAIRGMRGWCEEFGERQGIQVEFKSPEAKISLPREIGLCLFRVLQQALHNAAKYSGVRRMEVRLWEDSGEIHLVVSDLGKGFDLETAMQGRGLGLTSMQERVRLIKGIIEIQSKPMSGTTIHVRVPLTDLSGRDQDR
jgi:PAS domain S-box-containing protein